MENEKVKYLIDTINDMDIKDKLRLSICMSKSEWTGLIYNTKENYEKFDNMLKSIDEEYRTTLINFGKYKLVTFAMAKQQTKIKLHYIYLIIKTTHPMKIGCAEASKHFSLMIRTPHRRFEY